jgi:hypothetical protein
MSGKEGSDPLQKKNFDKTFEDEHKATNALVDIGTIQLTAEDLYDKDKVDLEQVHLEDVWKLLQYVSTSWFLLDSHTLFSTNAYSTLFELTEPPRRVYPQTKSQDDWKFLDPTN